VKQAAPAANPYPAPAQPKPAASRPAETPPAAPPAKPGKKKLLPILIGAAVLVLAAVLLIVFLPRGGSASPSTVSSRPSSASTSPSASSSDASAPSAQDTPSVEEPAPAAPVDLRIALITDYADVNDGGYNQAAWEGLVAFAESKGLRRGEGYDYYRPSGDSGEDRIAAVRTAVGNGANVIVCPGWLFEDVVYRLQNEYPDVMFLLLDGSPHSDDYSGIETAANTHCVFYQEEQAGFLAGYAAVKDGCRDLGFVGGMAVPAVVRYGYGFVQGANCAAEELGVADQVSVKYWYCNSYAPSDEIQSKASRWYADGTEVIFSCGGTSYLSVVAAAENRGGKVICQDFDMSSHSPCIVTSAAKDLGNSVVLSLEDLWNNNGVWSSRYAGSSAYLGAAENCIGLPAASASWRMSSFSVQEYEALYRKLQSGEILVSNDVTSEPSVSIAVDYYA
jgi:basic membrane protein A